MFRNNAMLKLIRLIDVVTSLNEDNMSSYNYVYSTECLHLHSTECLNMRSIIKLLKAYRFTKMRIGSVINLLVISKISCGNVAEINTT